MVFKNSFGQLKSTEYPPGFDEMHCCSLFLFDLLEKMNLNKNMPENVSVKTREMAFQEQAQILQWMDLFQTPII